MALKDGQMELAAALGTAAIIGALSIVVLWETAAGARPTHDDDHKMLVIEASLATKSTNKQTQPQKQFRAPEPPKPVEGIADTQKPPPPPPDKKPDPPKKEETLDQKLAALPPRPGGADDPVGKPTPENVPFNPNATGHGPANIGDPFFARLKEELLGDFAGHNVSDNPPSACIHLTPEGKIVDTKFETRSDDDVQEFAEAQLKKLVKSREAKPEAVPIQLIDITKQWLCFKFTVTK